MRTGCAILGQQARGCAPLLARGDHRGRAYGCAIKSRVMGSGHAQPLRDGAQPVRLMGARLRREAPLLARPGCASCGQRAAECRARFGGGGRRRADAVRRRLRQRCDG
ncbi:hypothetical protein F511_47329 [Dorcoceras hygrometricum]|uniref:Uncharacterized protein n=1 Tax=Dorcoceras hygrometricum TaxID=472368 RepID=A0A2Z6ZR87_9LAMI|nr:hypothetical protein F511_47329 [Dorcoceras hygrometricum]